MRDDLLIRSILVKHKYVRSWVIRLLRLNAQSWKRVEVPLRVTCKKEHNGLLPAAVVFPSQVALLEFSIDVVGLNILIMVAMQVFLYGHVSS